MSAAVSKGSNRVAIRRCAMPADPVCKMELSEEDAEATAEYKGMTYYFCSEACKEAFEHAPERFVKKTA